MTNYFSSIPSKATQIECKGFQQNLIFLIENILPYFHYIAFHNNKKIKGEQRDTFNQISPILSNFCVCVYVCCAVHNSSIITIIKSNSYANHFFCSKNDFIILIFYLYARECCPQPLPPPPSSSLPPSTVDGSTDKIIVSFTRWKYKYIQRGLRGMLEKKKRIQKEEKSVI